MKLAKNLTRHEIENYITEYESFWKTPKGKKDKLTFEGIHEALCVNGYLTTPQLKAVALWKTPRVSKIVNEKNDPDQIVREITAFALKIPDEKYKIRLLCSLDGIGIPRASAILAMSDPKKYGVIDVNAWRALTGEDRRVFNDDNWMFYLAEIRGLASRHGKTSREIDMALMKHGQKMKSDNRK